MFMTPCTDTNILSLHVNVTGIQTHLPSLPPSLHPSLPPSFPLFPVEEYNIYQTGLIPSQFIYSLDMKSLEMFKTVLWMSIITVISVSIVSIYVYTYYSTYVCIQFVIMYVHFREK